MNFRPLDVEDEEDRKRKARAAAKLQEIEERIARRQAEETWAICPFAPFSAPAFPVALGLAFSTADGWPSGAGRA